MFPFEICLTRIILLNSEYGDAVSYTSEGLMSNMRVNGGVMFGWQQQYLMRSSTRKYVEDSVWTTTVVPTTRSASVPKSRSTSGWRGHG